jgi:hypothetical protein
VWRRRNRSVAEFTNTAFPITIYSKLWQFKLQGKRLQKLQKSRSRTRLIFNSRHTPRTIFGKALDFLPIEHLRGIEKVKLVDFINDPRLKNLNVPIKGDLPGLYHPKQGNQGAWLEMSMGALLQPTEGFAKKWMAKSSFKGKSRRTDLLARRPALSSDAEALGEETKPRAADPPVRRETFASLERAAVAGKHPRKTLQAIPPDDRTLGKMAQQESGGSAKGEVVLFPGNYLIK